MRKTITVIIGEDLVFPRDNPDYETPSLLVHHLYMSRHLRSPVSSAILLATPRPPLSSPAASDAYAKPPGSSPSSLSLVSSLYSSQPGVLKRVVCYFSKNNVTRRMGHRHGLDVHHFFAPGVVQHALTLFLFEHPPPPPHCQRRIRISNFRPRNTEPYYVGEVSCKWPQWSSIPAMERFFGERGVNHRFIATTRKEAYVHEITTVVSLVKPEFPPADSSSHAPMLPMSSSILVFSISKRWMIHAVAALSLMTVPAERSARRRHQMNRRINYPLCNSTMVPGDYV